MTTSDAPPGRGYPDAASFATPARCGSPRRPAASSTAVLTTTDATDAAARRRRDRRVDAVVAAPAGVDRRPRHRRGTSSAGAADATGGAGGAATATTSPRSPLVGAVNPHSPPVRLGVPRRSGRSSRGVFGAAYEGPPGYVHGGWVALAFDEVLGIANVASGYGGLTGRLTVRYRRPTPLHTELRFEAHTERVDGRRLVTVGTLLRRRHADRRGRGPVRHARRRARARVLRRTARHPRPRRPAPLNPTWVRLHRRRAAAPTHPSRLHATRRTGCTAGVQPLPLTRRACTPPVGPAAPSPCSRSHSPVAPARHPSDRLHRRRAAAPTHPSRLHPPVGPAAPPACSRSHSPVAPARHPVGPAAPSPCSRSNRLGSMRRRDFLQAAGAVGGAVMLGGDRPARLRRRRRHRLRHRPRRFRARLPDRHRRRADDGEPVVRPLPRVARRRRAPTSRPGAGATASGFQVAGADRPRRTRPRRRPVATYPLVGAPSETNPWRGLRPPEPGPRLVRRARRARRGLPRAGHRERRVRARLLRRRGPPRPPAARAAASPSATATSPPCSAGRSRTASTCTRRRRTATRSIPDRCASASTPSRRSGTSSPPRSVDAAFYYTGFPGLMLFGERMDALHPADRPPTSRTAAAGTLPSVTFIEPSFGGGLRTDDHPRGDVQRRAALHPRVLRRVRGVAAVEARAVHPHLRRVGRLLRPRRAAASCPTTAPEPDRGRELRPARLPGPGRCSRRRTRAAATSTTASTTTPRSCGSSSGGSSVRRPRAPARAPQAGGSRSATTTRATSAGACGATRPEPDPGSTSAMELPQPSPNCADGPDGVPRRDRPGAASRSRSLRAEIRHFAERPRRAGSPHPTLTPWLDRPGTRFLRRARRPPHARPRPPVTPADRRRGGPRRATSRWPGPAESTGPTISPVGAGRVRVAQRAGDRLRTADDRARRRGRGARAFSAGGVVVGAEHEQAAPRARERRAPHRDRGSPRPRRAEAVGRRRPSGSSRRRARRRARARRSAVSADPDRGTRGRASRARVARSAATRSCHRAEPEPEALVLLAALVVPGADRREETRSRQSAGRVSSCGGERRRRAQRRPEARAAPTAMRVVAAATAASSVVPSSAGRRAPSAARRNRWSYTKTPSSPAASAPRATRERHGRDRRRTTGASGRASPHTLRSRRGRARPRRPPRPVAELGGHDRDRRAVRRTLEVVGERGAQTGRGGGRRARRARPRRR